MTIDGIEEVIQRSGERAETMASEPMAAAWMQVKMLAEIARQLAVLNSEPSFVQCGAVLKVEGGRPDLVCCLANGHPGTHRRLESGVPKP